MVRDFTEATKEKLSKEIDDINKKTWSPVTDAIGDTFMYAGKWLGILSLDDDMSNVESYQRNVLDMTDMTKKELNAIFDEVYGIDKDFKGYFANFNERENTYNSKLQTLYGMIKPNFTICDAKTIKSMVGKYNERLKDVDGKINKDFEKEIDWAAKEAALNSVKGLAGGVLKTVVDIAVLPVSMIKNVATGNYGGIFTDTWSLVDDVFAVGSNLVGLTSLGLGYFISACTGNKQQKNLAAKYGEAYGGVTGLTGTLEAEEKINGKNLITSFMLKGSKWIDTASAAVGLFGDVKGFLDNPTGMIDMKFGFKDKLGTLKKADMLEKYQGKYRKWQSLYRVFGKDSHYTTMKNISNGYKYLEPLWNLGEGVDTLMEAEGKKIVEGSQKWFETIGDAYEFGEDVAGLLFP